MYMLYTASELCIFSSHSLQLIIILHHLKNGMGDYSLCDYSMLGAGGEGLGL